VIPCTNINVCFFDVDPSNAQSAPHSQSGHNGEYSVHVLRRNQSFVNRFRVSRDIIDLVELLSEVRQNVDGLLSRRFRQISVAMELSHGFVMIVCINPFGIRHLVDTWNVSPSFSALWFSESTIVYNFCCGMFTRDVTDGCGVDLRVNAWS
jgi:hypothetical protein